MTGADGAALTPQMSNAEGEAWDDPFDTDSLRMCPCPSCNHYLPEGQYKPDTQCEVVAIIERICASRLAALTQDRDQAVAVADSMQHFADVAERVERRNNELVAERDEARAVVAAVRALADEWQRELDTRAISTEPARYCWSTAERELRALLPEPETSEACAEFGSHPRGGHEDAARRAREEG